jgi:hypothetical protein
MCREAVLNIVRDTLPFNYVIGTRHLMVPARLRRPSRCHSMINLAMNMPNILKDAVQAADVVWTAMTAPRDITSRGLFAASHSIPSTWPPHVTPAYPGSAVQNVPGVPAVDLNLDGDKLSSFAAARAGPHPSSSQCNACREPMRS